MNLKPIILLSEYQMLREIIKRNTDANLTKDVQQLSNELDRAIVIQEQELNKKIIRINSEVEFVEEKSKRKMKIQVVLPENADFKKGKISIFAPLATALIGFSENDSVNWNMPAGETKLSILSVSNENPEI
ncbi:GreA/GreB family elongation factor [Moheibacter sediminis]|uniref:Regulator of nucleoside diphosphate kinase n=1 Tax=Moheibacter sediminis TaxID=1434700 RepID=A0A1W1ZRF0_9FLAO|nr:GreA/GreB family elongation factor [Moheibacter sediminis]SMC51120.1 regulator of nucleoside diphosphate kinase [Moheibacter sediminis]